MERTDRLLLKAFLDCKVPKDFNAAPKKILMVDAIIGLADRVYHGEQLKRNEVRLYDLDQDTKKDIGNILSDDITNLQFYYLLKLVILILYKYSC